MFFLLRVAFWLTLALVLLPTGQQPQQAAQGPKVDPVDALSAAGTAVADMSNFCDRQAQACEVGAQTAAVIGQRAQAGAKMVYEFINERVVHNDNGPETTSGVAKSAMARTADGKLIPVMLPVPVSRGQSTLKPADLEPIWRDPSANREASPRADGKRPA